MVQFLGTYIHHHGAMIELTESYIVGIYNSGHMNGLVQETRNSIMMIISIAFS